MEDIDFSVPVRTGINRIWRNLDALPEGDIPAWANDAVLEIEKAERQEGFSICRTTADIDSLLQELLRQIRVIDEMFDDSENPLLADWKARKQRLLIEQRRLMAKAELLRRMEEASKVTPIKGKASVKDNRIVWLNGKPSAFDFMDDVMPHCSIPGNLALDLVVQGHFFEQGNPMPLLPGFPAPIKWLSDLKVLAFLFSSLASDGIIQKRQWKRIAAQFVDRNDRKIDPENFGTLRYKASDAAFRMVDDLRKDIGLGPMKV
jgi:hypothetical protein